MKIIINNYILDLTSNGVTTVEKNNVFRDSITKTFSFPFNLILTNEISEAFGIIEIDGIVNYPTKINVVISESNTYYNGYIRIKKIVNKVGTLTLYYGRETLLVYDQYLTTLPFEKIDVFDVKLYAQNQNTKQWPEASHNYVTIRDIEFKNNENYEDFAGYINNTENGSFIANEFKIVNEVSVPSNKNVIMPMPYIMEILKVGYKQESKVIKGSFVDDSFNHKIIHIPEKFLERYFTSVYDDSNFKMPTSNYVGGQNIYSSYLLKYAAHLEGTFELNFSLNFPKEIAELFELTINRGSKTLYSLKSKNKAINISETLIINVDNANTSEFVTVSLILNEQTESIDAFNSFVYEHKDKKLNLFANKYNLADFMPNITFRDFVNEIENLFNLDVDVQENVVYLNYLDETMQQIKYKNYSKYEVEDKIRDIDSEKTFSLKLADNSEIFVNNNGVLPISDSENLESHTTINIDVIPLNVSIEDGIKTANNTSDTSKLKLALYNGLVGNLPLAAESINGRSLTINDFYKKWVNWLKFRTSSEIYEDSFFAHVTENFNLKNGMIKYNKKHLIKEIKKVSINKDFNKITTISETF